MSEMKNYREDQLLDRVKKISEKELSSDDVRITFGKGSEKLDGFMGEILTICASDEITQKSLNLIAKVSLKDEKIRKYTVIRESYKNEIIVYTKFFPALQELRNQLKIPRPIGSLVKFYYASESEDDEMIIMENIKEIGYRMMPVRQLLNQEEIQHIFKGYGELHASSMALRALNPKKFEDITRGNVCVFRTLLDKKISKDFAHTMTSVRDAMRELYFEHKLLDKYSEDPLHILRQSFANFEKEKYVTFLHGDGWSNNIMFKYEMKNGREQLEDIKFLDWQAWTVGPPIVDVLFCLFSSCSEEVFLNFETHLKTYYNSFSDCLELYNLKAANLYPFQEMQEQLQKHYHFPAIFGVMIRKIRSFNENHNVDPVNYKPKDDDSTFFDAVREMEFDKEYLLQLLEYMLAFIDKKFN